MQTTDTTAQSGTQSDAPVTVYSKPRCVQCDATTRELDRIGVAYVKIDVSEDEVAYQRILNLGYRQVPVVETEETHWAGFRPDMIKALVA